MIRGEKEGEHVRVYAASVTQAVFFLWATGLVKHLHLSLPTLPTQISQR